VKDKPVQNVVQHNNNFIIIADLVEFVQILNQCCYKKSTKSYIAQKLFL